MASNNPFDFPLLEWAQASANNSAAASKKKAVSKSKKPTKPKKCSPTVLPPLPTYQDLFGDTATPPAPTASKLSDSDSEEEIPCAQPVASTSTAEPKSAPKRKRKSYVLPVESDEDEQDRTLAPVRASALKSFLSRRVGNGYTLQSDPTRRGDFYIELRVYNTREVEALDERWKHALVTYRSMINQNTAAWSHLQNLINAAKEEFKAIRPILYPSNIY